MTRHTLGLAPTWTNMAGKLAGERKKTVHSAGGGFGAGCAHTLACVLRSQRSLHSAHAQGSSGNDTASWGSSHAAHTLSGAGKGGVSEAS